MKILKIKELRRQLKDILQHFQLILQHVRFSPSSKVERNLFCLATERKLLLDGLFRLTINHHTAFTKLDRPGLLPYNEDKKNRKNISAVVTIMEAIGTYQMILERYYC